MYVIADMNRLTKLTQINLNKYHHFHLKTILFHSSSVLEVDPRRRTHWEARPYSDARKHRNKQYLQRNDGDYYVKFCPISSHERSHLRNDSSRFGEFNRTGPYSKRAQDLDKDQAGKKKFQSYDDDEEDDPRFGSTSRGNPRYTFWSFSDDESTWNSSAHYNYNRASSNQKRFEHDDNNDGDEYNKSSKSNRLETDLSKERIALGLSCSGPLRLEHVKDAYRASALKWHPDRHDGSSKAIAEEKFKVCSAAYQSLCDKLAQN